MAAYIEDCLTDAGAASVVVHTNSKQHFDPRQYDALIVNASQEGSEPFTMVNLAKEAGCTIVIIHDDVTRAGAAYPGSQIVEIPFDCHTVLDALKIALRE